MFGLRFLLFILGVIFMYYLDFYKEYYFEIVKLIKDFLYVDDLLVGVSDV